MLRCRVCQHVHTVEFRPPPPTNIPFILTDGPRSERVVLVVDADEAFVVGDVFEENEMLWSIHQIETRDGTMTTDEAAANIARITALRTDMVRVKLTLTRGEDSTADVIVVPQETTFTGSHLMEHNGETWRIRAIHTGAGRTMRGTVNAPDIKRMYLHEPPNPSTSHPERLGNDGRRGKKGAWDTTPTLNGPKSTSRKASTPTQREIARGRKRESDQGRLVHGIKNALATCDPMVGFSFRRRMLYSYHFSPYGM